MPLPLMLLLAFLAAAGLTATPVPEAHAGQKQAAEQKLEQIKQERARLRKIRAQLERKLGAMGRELRRLDEALVQAREASRKAAEDVRQADLRLARLKAQQNELKARIARLSERMQDEAVAAWQRSSRSSQWLGILTGVPVSDIPHRRYLLNLVMRSQNEDRRQYQQDIEALRHVEAALKAQRKELARLSEIRSAAEKEAAKRLEAKRQRVAEIRRELKGKKNREAQLAREQQALLDLLDSIDKGLLAADVPVKAQHIRRQKGRLPWPLKGRVVASFGSRPSPHRARLKGVQLKPLQSRQVRAMGAGQVRYADWFGGYGLMMIVDYGDGILGVYAHNDTLYQQLGDWVEKGDVLAEAGSTGWVSDVALYFEIRDRGKAVNPKRWCRR